jgi:ABC-2 type transport system ATP-binding protein
MVLRSLHRRTPCVPRFLGVEILKRISGLWVDSMDVHHCPLPIHSSTPYPSTHPLIHSSTPYPSTPYPSTHPLIHPSTPMPTPHSPIALHLHDLNKHFGSHTAVSQLNLRIPQGTFYALLGPNGAGKTTTLRMVAGLLQPDSGDVFVLGRSITRTPEAAKQVMAYLPDEPMLYGKLRPLEYLEFVAGLWGISAGKAQLRANELLQQLGLWEVRGDLSETFSRGMKQKLALAGAFIHNPQLIILDEPLSGLDAAAARLVKNMLVDFVKQGNTVILTTHIMEVAERMAQRIGIINHGRLVAEGTLEDLRVRSGEVGGTLESVFLELTQDKEGDFQDFS